MTDTEVPEARLLDCPFCGHALPLDEGLCVEKVDEFGYELDASEWRYTGICCAGCAAFVAGDGGTLEGAISAWNRRVARSPSPAGEGLVWEGEEGGPGCDITAKVNDKLSYLVRHVSAEDFDVLVQTDIGTERLPIGRFSYAEIYKHSYADAKDAAQEDRLLRLARPSPSEAPQEAEPVDAPDYFGELVERARVAAAKASIKFPQPNYVTLKIAEEAGEVVRGAVHYAENRMEWSEVEGEIVQLIAMLIRFVTEGDAINGVHPPAYIGVPIQIADPDTVATLKRERDEAIEALKFYALEDRYDYDETCSQTKRNRGEGILSDNGERARSIVSRSTAGRGK